MSVQNFSFIAGLEVTEKFVCGMVGWWWWVPSGYYVFEFSSVTLGFDNIVLLVLIVGPITSFKNSS